MQASAPLFAMPMIVVCLIHSFLLSFVLPARQCPRRQMVEGFAEPQSLGVHDGRRKTPSSSGVPVGIGGVDHDLASPVRSFGELILQPKGDGQDEIWALSASFSELAVTVGPIALACGAIDLGRPAARYGHLKVLTGERPGKRLANGAKSYNRRAHEILRITVKSGNTLITA